MGPPPARRLARIGHLAFGLAARLAHAFGFRLEAASATGPATADRLNACIGDALSETWSCVRAPGRPTDFPSAQDARQALGSLDEEIALGRLDGGATVSAPARDYTTSRQ